MISHGPQTPVSWVRLPSKVVPRGPELLFDELGTHRCIKVTLIACLMMGFPFSPLLSGRVHQKRLYRLPHASAFWGPQSMLSRGLLQQNWLIIAKRGQKWTFFCCASASVSFVSMRTHSFRHFLCACIWCMGDLAGKTIFEGSSTVTVAKQPSSIVPQWTLSFQANCSHTACHFFVATHCTRSCHRSCLWRKPCCHKGTTACRPPCLSGRHTLLQSVALCVTDTLLLSVANSDDGKARAFGSCWRGSALQANTQSCLIQSPSTESWLKVRGL